MKRGKKWKSAREKIDKNKEYTLSESINILRSGSYAKFDESLDIAVNLGVDPRKSDQTVRSVVVLPHGTGKNVRVLVFAQGDKAKEAQEAGADFIGGEDLAEKIQGGWMDFDAVVATPDMMKVVGKLGKVLGPHGLMPNPKVGTVTMDISKAVKDLKMGRVEFRVEKGGILHAAIGKMSFDPEKLKENVTAFIEAVLKAKPTTSKGQYVKKVTLSSTMGQGIRLSVSDMK